MIFVANISRKDFNRIDTKRLEMSLNAISSGASLVMGEAKGRTACWMELRRNESQSVIDSLTAAVLNEAARNKVVIA